MLQHFLNAKVAFCDGARVLEDCHYYDYHPAGHEFDRSRSTNMTSSTPAIRSCSSSRSTQIPMKNGTGLYKNSIVERGNTGM